jgi:hypothetical protein
MADRWTKRLARIDLDRVRERLDAALEPVAGPDVEGAIFLAREEDDPVFLEWAILEDLWYRDVVERVLGRDALRREVSCWTESSMVSSGWGFASGTIGPRGYFVDDPDPDTREDGLYRLLGAWEPAGSRSAYEAAWVETYVAWWGAIGLPPFRGESASAPEELWLRALERILGDDEASWAREVKEVLGGGPDGLREYAIDAAAEGTGLPDADVAEPIRAIAAGEPTPEVSDEVRRRIARQATSRCGEERTMGRPPRAAASEELATLLNEILFPIRKGFGMYLQIQIRVEDVTPRDLTVQAWTRKDIPPKELAHNVRNALLNYLRDCLPCERFRFLLLYPDRRTVRREYLLPFAKIARFAGMLRSQAVLIEQNVDPVRREFCPRIRAAWARLLEAWSEECEKGAGRSDGADRARNRPRDLGRDPLVRYLLEEPPARKGRSSVETLDRALYGT